MKIISDWSGPMEDSRDASSLEEMNESSRACSEESAVRSLESRFREVGLEPIRKGPIQNPRVQNLRDDVANREKHIERTEGKKGHTQLLILFINNNVSYYFK